jgi:L-fuconolactonase
MLDRRHFLTATISAVIADSVSSLQAAPTRTIIDTHTHFYDPTRKEGVPWPGKDDKVLYRPVLPAEFVKLTKPYGVTGTIVVEASAWLKDNDWLLDLAKDHPILQGIVGRILPGDEAFSVHLQRLSKNQLFKGIRINHEEVKTLSIDVEQRKRIATMIDVDASLDVNLSPDRLPDLITLAKALPRLRIVLNHIGNVEITKEAPPKAWSESIKILADLPNVVCKLSALVEGSRKRDAAPKDPAFYQATFDIVWKSFGSKRLLYGSNWPVSNLFTDYRTVIDVAEKLVLQAGGQEAFEQVFWKNAQRVYRLGSA